MKPIIEIKISQEMPVAIRENISQNLANEYPGYSVFLSVEEESGRVFTTIVNPKDDDYSAQRTIDLFTEAISQA